MTLFAAAIRLLGLSQAEAADYLRVSESQIKHWGAGRRPVPDGVWTELRTLYESQQTAVEAALDLIEEKNPDEIMPDIPGPRSKEWPSEGAHMAVAAAVALSADLPIAE